MRKIIISVFLILSLVFASTCGAYAAAPAASTQISTVVIDGSITRLNPMTQIINGEIYFPLGSALTVAGVTANSKSVKVGKAKFYAKTNSKSVIINGNAVQLKAPVLNRKNVLYIAGELISKFAGKRVLYSTELKTVSVVEEAQFSKAKALMNKVDAAMAGVKDYKFKMTTDMNMNFDMGMQAKVNMTLDGKADVSNKKAYSLTKTVTEAMGQSQNIDTETYSIGNKAYIKNPLTGKWTESPNEDMGIEMISGLIGDSSKESLDAAYDDVINSSLIITTDKSGKTTLIKSSILANVLVQESLKEVLGRGAPSTINVTIKVDNATNTISGMDMSFAGSMTSQGMKVKFSAKVVMSVFDYNKGVTIELPAELKG